MPDKLKDIFFTDQTINTFAEIISRRFPAFDTEQFRSLIYDDSWESRELKEKMRHTTICLRATLPDEYCDALEILIDIAPDVKGFEAMTLPDFVEVYGIDDWDASLPALKHFTRYSSSEFAIRPFLKKDPDRAMGLMHECAGDNHENIRRFASEGCRPRLPWAMALPAFKKDPSLIVPVLEKLKDDSSEFVRRSVANNLNDISKDNPDIMLNICERWFGKSKNTDRIVKHACRSLLKAGNKRALMLFGYGDPADVAVKDLGLDPQTVRIGSELRFSFQMEITSAKACNIRIEYGIDYMKANGKHSRKVFKITENSFDPGTYPISRKQSFAEMSTRKHHAGEHRISIIVNGEEKAHAAFEVIKE